MTKSPRQVPLGRVLEERLLLIQRVKSNKALLMAQSAKVSLRQHRRNLQRMVASQLQIPRSTYVLKKKSNEQKHSYRRK